MYDVAYGAKAGGPHRRKGFAPPGPLECAYRVFKSEDGTERLHTFARTERRDDVTAETLARQLVDPAWAPKTKFDAASIDAGARTAS